MVRIAGGAGGGAGAGTEVADGGGQTWGEAPGGWNFFACGMGMDLVNEGLNFFMHREYDRSQPKDDQTCERSLNTSSPRSGFVQQIAAGNAGWPVQFRFAVHSDWSRVPEL